MQIYSVYVYKRQDEATWRKEWGKKREIRRDRQSNFFFLFYLLYSWKLARFLFSFLRRPIQYKFLFSECSPGITFSNTALFHPIFDFRRLPILSLLQFVSNDSRIFFFRFYLLPHTESIYRWKIKFWDFVMPLVRCVCITFLENRHTMKPCISAYRLCINGWGSPLRIMSFNSLAYLLENGNS